jgi:alpha-L-fucosidase 2
MKITRREFVGTLPALAVVASSTPLSQLAPSEDNSWKLWYRQPATRWLDSLPVGNGRLGVMMFGGIDREKLALNESTVWSGAPSNNHENPEALAHLSEIRQLFFDGKYIEGREQCKKYLLGREDSYGTHLPMSYLDLRTHTLPADAKDYRRSLDLETGIARVEYSVDGVRLSRELFVSYPDNVIVLRLLADRPGQISVDAFINGGDLPSEARIQGNDTLVIHGHAYEKKHSNGQVGAEFQSWARVIPDGGDFQVKDNSISVKGANSVTVLIVANTNFGGGIPERLCQQQLKTVASKSYELLREAHLADHGRLYRRVSIDLGGANEANTPTDQRLAALQKGSDDPQLMALFFQYARYLLIAGSRENSPLPMNLQGIWNDNLACNMVWTCDFHLDINTQQNYWPAEVCNLTECNEPLFKLIEFLDVQGEKTAKGMYGANGWVAHVFTNAWGFTAPGPGLGWGLFPTGGAWIATHLWEHYKFCGDELFLEKRAYPILKHVAEFFLSYMVVHPKYGWLVTGPSVSPENAFLTPDGKPCSESMGPTCDRELVYAVFSECIEASTVLNTDAEFRTKLIAAREKLSPLRIGKHGQLQEWLEDFEEAIPNHRHTSHLLALYPLDQITVRQTPELAQAARVTLQRRTGQSDWEDTEWSRANLINFFARLQDGNMAHKHLVGLLREDTDVNMLTFSRAGIAGAVENIFAIDGNTAGAAGIAEMLVQSFGDIELLPALPKVWPTGSIHGLRARGGYDVDLQWKDRGLVSATIRSVNGGKRNVRYGEKVVALELKPGQAARFDQNLARVSTRPS